MASLTYQALLGNWWSGNITINYTSSYDSKTNRTTIQFLQSEHSYYGRNNYSTTANTTITIKASDNPSEQKTVTFSTSGVTNMAGKSYTGIPSPSEVVIQHSSTPGVKTVEISCSTVIYPLYPSSSYNTAQTANGSGSTSVTNVPSYTLSISADSSVSVSVNRTSSPYGNAPQGYISSGAALYYGDVLNINYSLSNGYTINTHTLNGSPFNSGISHTCTEDVSLVLTTSVASYLITLESDDYINIQINRLASPLGKGALGILTSNSAYYMDELEISAIPNSGYGIQSLSVNGKAVASPYRVTVTATLLIKAISKALGFFYIDSGSEIQQYRIFIDSGSGMEQYKAMLDTGSEIIPY